MYCTIRSIAGKGRRRRRRSFVVISLSLSLSLSLCLPSPHSGHLLLCHHRIQEGRRNNSRRRNIPSPMDPRQRSHHCLPSDLPISDGVQLCPFLRNIGASTLFSFSSPPSRFPLPVKGNRGPIFEDGPSFDLAFQLFHGKNGVVPLAQREQVTSNDKVTDSGNVKFNPLAASAAAISISAFGGSGPFSFDAFMAKNFNMKKSETPKKKEQPEKKTSSAQDHEAWSNEWLQTGNCPIAKSFRAVSGVLPLVAKVFQPPPGVKLRCPPAIVAARAALARTAAVKKLKPQPLPTRVLAVGLLGMALNVPLGVWREHTQKFSPAWFIAVHASVPFIAMLRKAVHMPKHVMAYTFAASILGQVIGSRAERRRIELAKASKLKETVLENGICESQLKESTIKMQSSSVEIFDAPHAKLQCGREAWDVPMKPFSYSDVLRA